MLPVRSVNPNGTLIRTLTETGKKIVEIIPKISLWYPGNSTVGKSTFENPIPYHVTVQR